jgi:hypothetical protein
MMQPTYDLSRKRQCRLAAGARPLQPDGRVVGGEDQPQGRPVLSRGHRFPCPAAFFGWMPQSAVVRDYRALETGRRRANRLELTVRGMKSLPQPNLSSRPKRMLPVLVRKAA